MSVTFKDRQDTSSILGRDLHSMVENFSHYLAKKVEKSRLLKFAPFGRFSDAEFYAVSGSDTYLHHYAVDEDRQRLAKFEVRPAEECGEDAEAGARIGKQFVKLHAQKNSLEEMDNAITDAIALIEKE